MKRSELKVGETYAVFGTPGAARRYMNRSYYYDKPFKATVIALDGTLVVREYQEISRSNGQLFDRQVTASGIIVEVAPFKRETPKFQLMSGYSDMPPRVAKFWDKVADEKTIETVTQIALENAGCFVSTWAEYERQVAEQEAWDARRIEEMRQQKARETEQAPVHERRVLAARVKLAEVFGDMTDRAKREPDYRYGAEFEFEAADGTRVRLKEQLGNMNREALVGAKITMSANALLQLVGLLDEETIREVLIDDGKEH